MSQTAPSIILSNIHQSFPSPAKKGEMVEVIHDVSLTLEGNQIVMLLGPSGCGKSTLMRMMGGSRPFNVKTPTSGTVMINGEVCNDQHNDVVMVFQKYLNRPDLTVLENVLFPFRAKVWNTRFPDVKERTDRAKALLEEVGLGDKMNYSCSQLSGGQNQRVAIARALVVQPRIILMDEPFGALDEQTRLEMQKLTARLHRQHNSLIVFVTHAIDEALLMGDRILVLSGKPAQISADIILDIPREMRDSHWLATKADVREQIYNLLG